MPLDNTSLILGGFKSMGDLANVYGQRKEQEAPASDMEQWIVQQLAQGLTPAEASAKYRLAVSGQIPEQVPGMPAQGAPPAPEAPQAPMSPAQMPVPQASQGLAGPPPPGTGTVLKLPIGAAPGAPGYRSIQAYPVDIPGGGLSAQAPAPSPAPSPAPARPAPPIPGIKTRREYESALKGFGQLAQMQPRRRSFEDEQALIEARGKSRMEAVEAQQKGAKERAALRAATALAGQKIDMAGLELKERMFLNGVSEIGNAIRLKREAAKEAAKLLAIQRRTAQDIQKIKLLSDTVGRLDSTIAATVGSDTYASGKFPELQDFVTGQISETEGLREMLNQVMQEEGVTPPQTNTFQDVLNFFTQGAPGANPPETPDIPTDVPVREPSTGWTPAKQTRLDELRRKLKGGRAP